MKKSVKAKFRDFKEYFGKKVIFYPVLGDFALTKDVCAEGIVADINIEKGITIMNLEEGLEDVPIFCVIKPPDRNLFNHYLEVFHTTIDNINKGRLPLHMFGKSYSAKNMKKMCPFGGGK